MQPNPSFLPGPDGPEKKPVNVPAAVPPREHQVEPPKRTATWGILIAVAVVAAGGYYYKSQSDAKEAAKGPGGGILVLAGSEVDILADGSLDYEDELLAKLDWVVASPHAALTQEPDPATARLVRAASNPFVTVMGHPTGRIVPSRRGLEPDMSKVIFAAARAGTAMEINAHYYRLDLRDIHVKMAVDANVPICINTDSHGFADFDNMRYGILTARRGWATKAHVLNTKPRAEFEKWLKTRKEAALF